MRHITKRNLKSTRLKWTSQYRRRRSPSERMAEDMEVVVDMEGIIKVTEEEGEGIAEEAVVIVEEEARISEEIVTDIEVEEGEEEEVEVVVVVEGVDFIDCS